MSGRAGFRWIWDACTFGGTGLFIAFEGPRWLIAVWTVLMTALAVTRSMQAHYADQLIALYKEQASGR